jgi:hypothetical protein
MKLSSYDEVLKDSVGMDVQARYVDEIRRLRTLGFDEEFYLRETAFPFSAVLLFPFLIYMFVRGERIRAGGLLQAMVFNPFLIHKSGDTYCTMTKQGVKYATTFDDGTLLTTTTFNNGVETNLAYQFIRQHTVTGGIVGAWDHHVHYMNNLIDEGCRVIAPIGMKDVIRIEQRTDKIITGIGLDDVKQKRKEKG